MRGLSSDLRGALRSFAKNPIFLLLSTLALGVGIGSNTAMFSVADALCFRPLKLIEEERLIAVQGLWKGSENWSLISDLDFSEWKRQSKLVDNFAAYEWASLNLTGDGEPERLQAFAVSGDFFPAMRHAPLLGRTIAPADVKEGQDRVAVISYGLWMRRFGADPAIAGRQIQLNGRAHVVIGVMPDDYRFPSAAQVWVPRILSPEEQQSKAFRVGTVARLRSGVTLEQARAEFTAFAQRMTEQYPDTHANRRSYVLPLKELIVGDYTIRYTWMMLGSAAFLLLIACANTGALQFVRSSARVRELSIRRALGATRGRLVRQLLTESIAVSFIATVLGLAIAVWFIHLVKSSMPAEIEQFLPGWRRMGIDHVVFGYTAVIASLAGILSGILPALHSSRADVNEALKEGGRSNTAGSSRHRLRNLLVASEIAMALVLLVGAVLLTKGLQNTLNPLPQSQPDKLLTVRIALPDSKYPKNEDVAAFQERLMSRLRGAALVTNLPYSQSSFNSGFTVEGHQRQPGEPSLALWQATSEDYFRMLGIPLKQGRVFDKSDGRDSTPVAIVSENFARRYWPGQDPTGKRIRFGISPASPWMTVVGVAGDVYHDGYDREPRLTVYRPYLQMPGRTTNLALRAENPLAALAGLRREIAAIDADLPVWEPRSFAIVIRDNMLGFAYVASMMAVLGAIALVLSAVGIYTVMAHAVVERTHEIGIRMALGAQPLDVLRSLAAQGVLLTAAALAVGLAAAFGMARLLAGLIFGVSASDPAVFIAVPLLLGAVAVTASWLPARRATKLDPLIALRHE